MTCEMKVFKIIISIILKSIFHISIKPSHASSFFRCIGIGIHQSRTFFSNGGQLKHHSDSDSQSLPSSSSLSSTKLSSIYGLDMMHLLCVKLQRPWMERIKLLNAVLLPRLQLNWLVAEIAANAQLLSICVDTLPPLNPSSDRLSLPFPIFIACS
jgi:hypothetical protein